MKTTIDAAIAVVHRGSSILICQRKANDTLGGFWEFPGGKQEPGESLEQCLARELREELAIKVSVLRRLSTVEHDYRKALVRLHPFLCRLDSGEPTPLECDDMRWIAPEALPTYRFPPANDALFAEVVEQMRLL